jgi:hypothetical protein
MAALTTSRNTLKRGPDLLVAPLAASAVIHSGALVALNAAGYAVPGSVSATLKAAGRAQYSVNNSSGAAGAAKIEIERGVFRYLNHGADLVTQADLLSDCYIIDDQTVAKTNGSNARSRAGKVLELDDGGVWVEIR